MSRLLSVALTEAAARAQTKTVTRRLGWLMLKRGDQLTLVRKTMGRRRKDGTVEPLVRICDVRVRSVRREPLHAITKADVAREGFAGWTPAQFVDFFVEHMRCQPATEVTRIEFEYLAEAVTAQLAEVEAARGAA
jgi:hypothetical protein